MKHCSAEPSQEKFNRGVALLQGGLTFWNLTKTPLIYSVSYFNWWAWILFERAKPTNYPRGDGTAAVVWKLGGWGGGSASPTVLICCKIRKKSERIWGRKFRNFLAIPMKLYFIFVECIRRISLLLHGKHFKYIYTLYKINRLFLVLRVLVCERYHIVRLDEYVTHLKALAKEGISFMCFTDCTMR